MAEKIDLSEISDEDLEKECQKRKEARKKARKEKAENKICCRNCVYRIIGKSYKFGLRSETYVCLRKPRNYTRTYARRVPSYLQGFYACFSSFNKNCPLFINKRSERGKEIAQKLKTRYKEQY